MDFGPYNAFPSSDVPEMVNQQISWNSLVISTYLLYLAWNVGMLAVNTCILWPPTVMYIAKLKMEQKSYETISNDFGKGFENSTMEGGENGLT
jgi:hypothetical protein